MTKWVTIAKHEYAYNVHRKEFIFVTLGLPLLISAIVGLPVLLAASSTGHEEYKIGYVDKTGLFYAGNFTRYANEETAKKDLLDDRITHFFVIPADYVASGKIDIFSTKREFPGSRTVEGQIESFLLDNLLKGEKKDIAVRVKSPMDSEYFTLGESGGSRKVVDAAFAQCSGRNRTGVLATSATRPARRSA